jgi:hypothetical protein
MSTMWDVFISHAAEDKAEVARPLAEALTRAGFRVWYDELTLSVGDSLRRTIDRGLAESRYGVVILSPNFLAKEWPRRELDGLTAREVASGKVILPVWHRLGREQIERFSPPLADKLGVSTDRGIGHVAEQIVQVLRGPGAGPVEPMPLPDPRRRRWLVGAGATAAGAAALAAGYLALRAPGGAGSAAAAITGRWVIEGTRVTPRTYLDLEVRGNRLSGTSEILYPNHPDFVISGLYAQRKTAITDARLADGTLAFTTRRRLAPRLTDPSTRADLVHRYEGRVDGERLRFTVQVEGGPIEEVVAERARPTASTAQRVATLDGHEGSINQMAVLADGRLASASRDLTARVWNLTRLQAEWVLEHESQVEAVYPSGAGTLVSIQDSGPLQEWDLASGKPRRELQRPEGRAIATSLLPARRLAVSLTTDRVGLWSLESGRVERTLSTGAQAVVAMTPLADGTLACGNSDGGIDIWDIAAGRRLRQVRAGATGSGRSVSGLQAMADGRLAYSVTGEAAARVWDPRTGQESQIANAKAATWTEVLAAVGNGRLALQDSNQTIFLWDPASGRSDPAIDLEREEYGLGCVTALPEGRLAVGMGDGPIHVWRLA